jgi:hypothetical protein
VWVTSFMLSSCYTGGPLTDSRPVTAMTGKHQQTRI